MRLRSRLPALRVATLVLVLIATLSVIIGILENVVRLPTWMQRYAWLLLIVSIGGIVALLHWQDKIGEQTDSAINQSAVNAIQVRELRQRFDSVPLQASTPTELLKLAKDPSLRPWITAYLISQVRPGDSMRLDPTERYWAYIALGVLRGRAARRCLKEGLRDDHIFARLGAEDALGQRRGWTRVLPRFLRKGGSQTGSTP